MSTHPDQVIKWRQTVVPAGDISILVRRSLRHADSAAHSHDFMEIVLIDSGTALHRSAAGDRRLSRGDVIIMRPGSWHAYVNCEGFGLYNLLFRTEVLHRELSWALADPTLSALLVSGPLSAANRGVMHLRLRQDAVPTCEGHLDALAELSQKGTSGAERAHRVGLLLLVLGDLIAGSAVWNRSADAGQGVHPAVSRGMHVLQRGVGQAWTLDRLAKQVGAERSYLIRLFKAGTGLPPMAYLARCRAERAAGLLLKTDDQVAEIARRVGWADPAYFARRFKTHFGVSATTYRKRFADVWHGAEEGDL